MTIVFSGRRLRAARGRGGRSAMFACARSWRSTARSLSWLSTARFGGPPPSVGPPPFVSAIRIWRSTALRRSTALCFRSSHLAVHRPSSPRPTGTPQRLALAAPGRRSARRWGAPLAHGGRLRRHRRGHRGAEGGAAWRQQGASRGGALQPLARGGLDEAFRGGVGGWGEEGGSGGGGGGGFFFFSQ